MSLCQNPTKLADLERIKFDVFDLISINGRELLNIHYRRRLEILNMLFSRAPKSNKVKVVKHFGNTVVQELPQLFDKYVLQKLQEGFIIWSQYGLMFKLKNVHEIDVVIIGYTEVEKSKQINGKAAISSLFIALIKPDNTYQVLTRVKAGITNVQREHLYDLLKDDQINSRYHYKCDSGKPFMFVKPNHVIQIRFLDIVPRGLHGEKINLPVLSLQRNEWIVLENNEFIHILNPWFDAFRSQVSQDQFPSLVSINPKEPIYIDVKIDQIYPIMKRLGISLDQGNIVKDSFYKRIDENDMEGLYQLIQDGFLSTEYLSEEEMQTIMKKTNLNLID